MLVLTRKKEEIIRIGQDITVRILQIRGRSVQLGIEAPRSVEVVRGELVSTPRKPTGAQTVDPQTPAGVTP